VTFADRRFDGLHARAHRAGAEPGRVAAATFAEYRSREHTRAGLW